MSALTDSLVIHIIMSSKKKKANNFHYHPLLIISTHNRVIDWAARIDADLKWNQYYILKYIKSRQLKEESIFHTFHQRDFPVPLGSSS